MKWKELLPVTPGRKLINKWHFATAFAACCLCYPFFLSATPPGTAMPQTLVLAKNQLPGELKKFNASRVYLLFYGSTYLEKYQGRFLRKDTITDLKKFKDSLGKGIEGYRLLFEQKGNTDSAWQTDAAYRVTDKAINLGNHMLQVHAYNPAGKQTDQFIFNYGLKYKKNIPALPELLRQYTVYTSFDRNEYAIRSVWILSVGIDDYGNTKWKNSKSDATSYVEFFREQFARLNGVTAAEVAPVFHEYLLLDGQATREAILKALKDIASKAVYNDYFIFNFSGQSNMFGKDSVTYFFPYDVSGYIFKPANRNVKDTSPVTNNLLSLVTLQEHIQFIQANNQLFISEAGPSEKFKTEFIRTLMQNSPAIASILNKNRIIIVPNRFGVDDFSCAGKRTGKAPINFYITSLGKDYNIYHLFREDQRAREIAFELKTADYKCAGFSYEYFDVFFEKEFLRQYREISGSGRNTNTLRGLGTRSTNQDTAYRPGKKFALVVGIDNYQGAGWTKLYNPVLDATAISEVLEKSYGFETTLLTRNDNTRMDSIYATIMEYNRVLQPDDDLLIYFAGHGDFDDQLLDDGFIVCSDSKSLEEDPVRNSYIQHSKLKRMLNKIRARQVLVILDICFGGSFDDRVLGNRKQDDDFFTRKNTEDNLTGTTAFTSNIRQFLAEKRQLKTRKALSSVGTEPAFDGTAGQHSPFANLLLQVLRARGAGTNGIVTLTNIYAVLQNSALDETSVLKISPHIAYFGENEPYSEFILVPAGH